MQTSLKPIWPLAMTGRKMKCSFPADLYSWGELVVSGRVGKKQVKEGEGNIWNLLHIPGDWIRDLLIPDRWRSPTTFERVTFHHPKKDTKNCQVYIYIYIYFFVLINMIEIIHDSIKKPMVHSTDICQVKWIQLTNQAIQSFDFWCL